MTGGGRHRLMRMAVLALALGMCPAIRGAAQQPDRAIINANGTWRIGADAAGDNAEKSRGKWTARFQVDPSGALTGTIALEGMGNGTPAEIEGTVDGNQIKFGLVSTRADTPAGKQSVCAFEGTMQGVRLEGTFSDPQGREGRWDGWWNSADRKAKGAEGSTGPTVIVDR